MTIDNEPEEYETDYSEEDEEIQLVYANQGKRLTNHIIDQVSFLIFLPFLAVIIQFVSPSTIDTIRSTQSNDGFNLINQLIFMMLYAFYMFIMESLSNGKSLGKLITNTRAVNDDGTDLSVKASFIRNICRLVPFEAFSALGTPSYPWHDKWSNTMVIDEKLSVF